MIIFQLVSEIHQLLGIDYLLYSVSSNLETCNYVMEHLGNYSWWVYLAGLKICL